MPWWSLLCGLALASGQPAGLADRSAEEATDEASAVAEARLRPAPRRAVDYTAYTLDWGEVEIGVRGVRVGVLPRVHLGTSPVLDVLGVYNGHVAWNAITLGPLDLGLQGAHHRMAGEDLRGHWTGAGALASLRLGGLVGLHGGMGALRLGARGNGSFDPYHNVLIKIDERILGFVEHWVTLQRDLPYGARLQGEGMWVRAATDVHLGRIGAVVLQVQGVPWLQGRTWAEGEAAELMGVDEAYRTPLPFDQVWVATASFELTLPNLRLRMGGGASSVPHLWLAQGNDIAARFGGRAARERRAAAEGR